MVMGKGLCSWTAPACFISNIRCDMAWVCLSARQGCYARLLWDCTARMLSVVHLLQPAQFANTVSCMLQVVAVATARLNPATRSSFLVSVVTVKPCGRQGALMVTFVLCFATIPAATSCSWQHHASVTRSCAGHVHSGWWRRYSRLSNLQNPRGFAGLKALNTCGWVVLCLYTQSASTARPAAACYPMHGPLWVSLQCVLLICRVGACLCILCRLVKSLSRSGPVHYNACHTVAWSKASGLPVSVTWLTVS